MEARTMRGTDNNAIEARIAGALLGVAIGDALGGPVEFMSQYSIKEKYGKVTEMIGGGWLDLKPGETTDDTAMTLAVARGILKNPGDPVDAIGSEFEKWYLSRPKDIGAICSKAITAHLYSNTVKNKTEWGEAAIAAHRANGERSAGNGALMRCIYPALFYKGDLAALDVTEDQAEMTHYDMQSTEACLIYCRLVRAFLKTPAGYARARLKQIIKDIFNWTPYAGANLWTRDDLDPTGYVVDTMKCALWALVKGRSFEDTLVRAVNLGGDADTIGAIVGGLAGAFYGADAIPDRWKKTLDPNVGLEIMNLAEAAIQNRRE